MASAFDRFFRNPRTGRLAIAQWPNLPLGIFLAATAVRLALRPGGAAGTATSLIGRVALAWWAADEVVRGDSPFRRLLGAVVLVNLLAAAVTG